MRNRGLVSLTILVAVVMVPVSAQAVTPSKSTSPSVSATRSASASRTYDLDFTLPTAGKSGCLVCHGDPNLVKVDVGGARSIYVDVADLKKSAHKDTPCTGCHVDFAYKTPHDNAAKGDAWREVARLACKNCHEKAFSNYASSAHSPAATPGEDATAVAAARAKAGKPTRVPFCGDCHGGHDIPSSSDKEGRAAVQASALKMCGACHKSESVTYDDYYHGAAYREGASDAPACWDCHAAHLVYPVKDDRSLMHDTRIAPTCGKTGCHKGSSEDFVEYAAYIHGGDGELDENVVWSVIDSVRSWFSGLADSVSSWF